MLTQLWVVLVSTMLILATSVAANAQSTALIQIDASRPVGRVNPWAFGNNTIGYQKGCPYAAEVYWNRGSGIWDPVRRESVPQMVELAKDCGFSVARYPGGTSSDIFDWKKAIGPLKDRPDQQFGLPEYLQNCRDIGAEPIITLAVWAWKNRSAAEELQDAADLVEYLNSPNDGKHPWAAKRAADGHPAPWNVKWFELGNETDVGLNANWGWVAFSPESYAKAYLKYQKAMKAVDPGIKLGACMETGLRDPWGWPRRVLEICGKSVDFLISHAYYLDYDPKSALPIQQLLTGVLTAPSRVQYHYDALEDMVQRVTGRNDIPIAVTEYTSCILLPDILNTQATGLNLANILPVFMRPRNHIVMACYWQFANETFGMVRGYAYKGETLVKTPDYLVMQLYHDHFGRELLAPKVKCDTYDLPVNFPRVATGNRGAGFRLIPGTKSIDSPWKAVGGQPGIRSQTVDKDTFTVNVDSPSEINYTGAYKLLPVQPNAGYRISGWVKTDGFPKVEDTMGQTVYSAFLEISDATAKAGASASANAQGATSPEFADSSEAHKVSDDHGVSGTTNWTRLIMDYVTGPHCKTLKIATRISGSRMPIRGTAWFKDLSYQNFVPHEFPPTPVLSVNASRSFEGKRHTVYLMIVNRKMDSSVNATVDLSGCSPTSAQTWEMYAPLDARNTQEHPDNVKIRRHDLGQVNNGFVITIEPHSVMAVEIAVK